MFTHILVPTDGSKLALKAAYIGADLAKKANAKMTAVNVIHAYETPYAGEGLFFRTKVSESEYMEAQRKHAEEATAEVVAIAREAGVACGVETVIGNTPWEGILEAASNLGCDTIAMSSHGRTAITETMLGSQTNRVLSHTKLPVLICR